MFYVFSVIAICLSDNDVRNFTYRAHQKGMTGPEFVYIYYTLNPDNFTERPWEHGENVTSEELEMRKEAFRHFKMVREQRVRKWGGHWFNKSF